MFSSKLLIFETKKKIHHTYFIIHMMVSSKYKMAQNDIDKKEKIKE